MSNSLLYILVFAIIFIIVFSLLPLFVSVDTFEIVLKTISDYALVALTFALIYWPITLLLIMAVFYIARSKKQA
jgi:hypothetical protein